jgi:UDP-N-acetylglucosamine 2-epimerase (non-hydrolysing)
VEIVYPVHLNPSVREPVNRILREHPDRSRVHLLEPLPYVDFVYLLSRCHIVLTDSGGVQEEAPALGKPVLIMRDVTERPEVVEAGGAVLVGADRNRIATEVRGLLSVPERYREMAQPRFVFGDGHAAERIAQILAESPLIASGRTHSRSDGCGARATPAAR